MRQLNAAIVAVCLLISSCSVQPIKRLTHLDITPPVVTDLHIAIENPKYVPIELPTVSEEDINCMAHGIYYEASNQGERGMEAVGFVIYNRSINPKYPNSICKVIKQTNVIHGKRFCQFSWYCKRGDKGLQYAPDTEAFRQSNHIARMILHKEIDNWMPRVVSFHRVGIRTNWNKHLSVFATIGQHVFYQENHS